VGWLSSKRRDELLDLLGALAARDPEALRDVLLTWADGHRVSAERFSEDLGRLLHLYEHASLRQIHLSTLLGEITGIMREHHLVLPADLALLFKAIMTLEGVGMRLVPHFQLIEHLTPRVRALILERWSPRRVAGRMSDSAREWSRAARSAPRLFESLARRFSDDGVALRFEVREIEIFSRHLERSVNRATIGVVTAALMVGSAIMLSSDLIETSFILRVLAGLGILISFANTLWLILSIRRSGR
jgi:ubiquinone biosynthesis protein